MNKRRKIFFALTLLWMAGIFAFSSRSGSKSTEDSYFAGTVVGRIFVPGYEEWSAEEQKIFAEKIDHPVRKSAHAAEYAALGVLAAGTCIHARKEDTVRRRRIFREFLLPWGVASLYAATDEFHQLFVPGRSGQFSDVLLDSAGALAGMLILTAGRILWHRRQQIRNSGAV